MTVRLYAGSIMDGITFGWSARNRVAIAATIVAAVVTNAQPSRSH